MLWILSCKSVFPSNTEVDIIWEEIHSPVVLFCPLLISQILSTNLHLCPLHLYSSEEWISPEGRWGLGYLSLGWTLSWNACNFKLSKLKPLPGRPTEHIDNVTCIHAVCSREDPTGLNEDASAVMTVGFTGSPGSDLQRCLPRVGRRHSLLAPKDSGSGATRLRLPTLGKRSTGGSIGGGGLSGLIDNRDSRRDCGVRERGEEDVRMSDSQIILHSRKILQSLDFVNFYTNWLHVTLYFTFTQNDM